MRNPIIFNLLIAASLLSGCGSTNVYPLFSAEHVTAQSPAYLAGYRYQNGIDVPRNYKRAISEYSSAASNGDAKALNNLGVMAMRGQGTTVSPDKAMDYFQRAALGGSAAAHFNMGLLYDTGFGQTRNPGLAAKEYRIAAVMGHSDAQYRLSTMIEGGEVMSSDPTEARRLLEMAIASGNKEAKARVEGISRDSDVTRFLATENCKECISPAEKQMATRDLDNLKKLAESGDAPARYNLGVKLLNGDGANNDPSEAARMFTLAARQGYAPAQRQIAQMHLRGQAVGKSKILAHMWLNLAAKSSGKESDLAMSEMQALEQSMTTSEIEQAQQLAAAGAGEGR